MGIAYCRKTGRLLVASLNTGKVEVFSNASPGGPGGDGQGDSMTFSSSGGGCSMAGSSGSREDFTDTSILLSGLFLFGLSRFRRKRNRTADDFR
jgi:hypothetical protein